VFIFLLSFFIYRFSPMMSLKVNIFINYALKIAESRANKDEGPKNIADVLDATVARIEQLFQQKYLAIADELFGADWADAVARLGAEVLRASPRQA
ncbi:hypothetical protein O5290_30070, partial [Escherichia coli]|nr:hypothetical protein [Escherichia coli]